MFCFLIAGIFRDETGFVHSKLLFTIFRCSSNRFKSKWMMWWSINVFVLLSFVYSVILSTYFELKIDIKGSISQTKQSQSLLNHFTCLEIVIKTVNFVRFYICFSFFFLIYNRIVRRQQLMNSCFLFSLLLCTLNLHDFINQAGKEKQNKRNSLCSSVSVLHSPAAGFVYFLFQTWLFFCSFSFFLTLFLCEL